MAVVKVTLTKPDGEVVEQIVIDDPRYENEGVLRYAIINTLELKFEVRED
jgi:hypothetical protein